MGKEKLINGYKKIISTIFEPNFYYGTLNKFVANYNSTVKGKLSLLSVIAFFISAWKIGILSGERILYWKLFFNTLKRNPKALPIAIELAVFGVHFKKVAEKVMNSN
jgi:hypothetical protein